MKQSDNNPHAFQGAMKHENPGGQAPLQGRSKLLPGVLVIAVLCGLLRVLTDAGMET